MEEIVQEVNVNPQTKWRSLPTFMTIKRSMPHSFIFQTNNLLDEFQLVEFQQVGNIFKGVSSRSTRFTPTKCRSFNGVHDCKVVNALHSNMEDYIHIMKVNSNPMVELVRSYLKGYASTWWRNVR
jgi:uncharacterized alpha-E superfamily protein